MNLCLLLIESAMQKNKHPGFIKVYLASVDAPSSTQNFSFRKHRIKSWCWWFSTTDCDVIVQADTSISRVHAEIAIEKMVAWDLNSGAPASPSYVRVVDRSKYGTFVNKVHGTQGSRLHKDEDVMLTDGDTVTFGTGNATFRWAQVKICHTWCMFSRLTFFFATCCYEWIRTPINTWCWHGFLLNSYISLWSFAVKVECISCINYCFFIYLTGCHSFP